MSDEGTLISLLTCKSKIFKYVQYSLSLILVPKTLLILSTSIGILILG